MNNSISNNASNNASSNVNCAAMNVRASLSTGAGKADPNAAHKGINSAAIALRAVAAVVGGYALTAAATSLLGVLLAALAVASRADSAIIATMLSFPIYACAVLWAFAARSARLACGALLTLTGMLALLLMLTGPGLPAPWLQ